MAQSILSDGSRGVWPEVRKIKGKKGKMACSMDGCNDNDDIANIFSDKYVELYNSVSYDTSEMKSIESSVLSRILNSSCSDYIITVTDVMNAIAHLKARCTPEKLTILTKHSKTLLFSHVVKNIVNYQLQKFYL